MVFDIREQPNVFDDAFLDIIGNEFRFDHVKGLAEWVKNSADAYTRADVPDQDQLIFLRFTSRAHSQPAMFSCIDFVGMTSDDIDHAFKRWGDRRAASRGSGKRTLGGHGNGGKFYMRQMFKTSRFVTYRDGRLNVFGFNERRRYGYGEGYQDRGMDVSGALEFATLTDLEIPSAIQDFWRRAGVGFTVVSGEAPERLRGWKGSIREIASKLRVHPQSRRLIRHKQVHLWVPPSKPLRLMPENIEPKPGFEGPYEFEIPEGISSEGNVITYRSATYPEGHLVIYTSNEPFSRAGERSSLNSIDILGEVGCIGSYRMNEIGYLQHAAQAEFLYGECVCPILEDPQDDCVRNDREKLVETEKTMTLLRWIRDRVDEICGQMADEERKERRQSELRNSAALNSLLDSWKNRFMSRVFAEILTGCNWRGGLWHWERRWNGSMVRRRDKIRRRQDTGRQGYGSHGRRRRGSAEEGTAFSKSVALEP